MKGALIAYFAKRHILTNLIFLGVVLGSIFAWTKTSKEELPDVTFNFVRVSASYPGAPAEDVEYFVVRPIEEKLRGLDGVYRIKSTCSVGQGNINVELEQDLANVEEVVTEIRNTVLDVQLPDDVINDPTVRVFKTSKKAILDIALTHKEHHLLDDTSRRELQKYAFALESQLLNLPQVHSVSRRGYLKEEIQIKVDPKLLTRYDIPFNTVSRTIRENHIRQPAGTIEMEGEPKVTLLSELNAASRLNELGIQGGFEGQVIRLEEIAHTKETYEKNPSIMKVNGHEAVMFSVVKSGSHGILEALEAVNKAVENFRTNLQGTPIEMATLDDESIDVRNRLKLITANGGIGFILIIASLFIFLNRRAGFWVAMGIPFTFCSTMILASLLGYTINGTTLAAVIIVMGIVVDDAIIVAENISRLEHEGLPRSQAVVDGTSYVFMPILASIATTMVAFVPLFFFGGHFGKFNQFIPPIIFFMLGASFLESLFILPGHMDLKLSFFKKRKKVQPKNDGESVDHWFDRIENKYSWFLEKILPHKWLILGGLIGLLALSGFIVKNKMKFVMFPNEETRDLVLSGKTPKGSNRFETAEKTREIEALLNPYIGKEVVGYRTSIARSRRGGAVHENGFRILIEIVPKEKRDKSADQLIKELNEPIQKLKGFKKIAFQKSRWGQDSGSAIELIVQQNQDDIRREVSLKVQEKMKAYSELNNVEIEEGLFVKEYRVNINREKIKRLSINAGDVSSTFRAALEGVILYEFSNGDEEVRVRLTTIDEAKNDMNKVLAIPVENQRNYLVPLRDIVTVKEVTSPTTISRLDLKRTTMIYADMQIKSKTTPLEAAEYLEANVFPDILSQFPTTSVTFGGEVQDTRESKQDFANSVIMVIILIYVILAILFDSLYKPLFIMLAIPFGLVGVILAFYLHGKILFGFFAAIGTLGLAGVVINDSIVMLTKLDDKFDRALSHTLANHQISQIAKTRLRAVFLTTLTTVVGVLPTAYGLTGYDAMLAEMMLALAWGMVFGTVVTLVLVPCLYQIGQDFRNRFSNQGQKT